MKFKTINKNSTAEIVEKKSRFIANIFYVETVEQSEEYIKHVKKEHYGARHNCFAYVITDINGNITKKSNDDGEPSGTAGAPILKMLEEENLSNILVVVTRYFGGILLGTGGLVRAYSLSAKKGIENTQYIEKTIGYSMKLEVDYKNINQIKYYLEKENIKINDIKYNERIEVIIEVPENKLSLFTQGNENFEGKIIKSEIMTKKYVEI